MRKLYSREIWLLIILSVSAASLGADNHLFEVVFKGLNLCGGYVNGEWAFNKQCLDINITSIRLSSFGLTLAFVAANILQYLHSEQSIIKALTHSLYSTFFSNLPPDNDSSSLSDSIYRVTCYKYVGFSFAPLLITPVLLIASFSLLYSFIKLPLLWSLLFSGIPPVIYFVWLHKTDNWWYHFCRRLNQRERWLKIGCNYLLGYHRYGKENGVKNFKPTTLPFRIDRSGDVYRMFVGRVASATDVQHCLNNHNINRYVSEITLSEYQLNGLKGLAEKSIQENITELEKLVAFNGIDVLKKNHIKDFMLSTNTAAWDLFNINGKRHCNHFVGFQVLDGGTLWGVVVIDVLDETIVDGQPKNFYQILHKPEDLNWLLFNLQSYSTIFSKAVNPVDS